MLDWERWTLTHSSGDAVVLALPLFFRLAVELGLVTTWTASAAAVADVPEVPDGEAEGVGLGALLTLAVGDKAVVGGLVTRADWLAAGLGVVEWLADGLVEGEADGDGDGEREGEPDGEGVGVLADGSAWHTLSVFAVVAAGAACAACAVPSAPRVRKLPLSKVTAATLACAKRIRIACLRYSSGLPCALRDSEATRGRMGTGTHFSAYRLHMHHPSSALPVLRITAESARAPAGGLRLPASARI